MNVYSRAKLLLKKKRFQESMLDKSEKQLDNIQEMCGSLEFAAIEMKVCFIYHTISHTHAI